MVNTVFNSTSQLSHTLHRIEENAGGADKIRNSDQLKIQSQTKRDDGEIIYEVKTAHKKSSLNATVAKVLPVTPKLLQSALDRHDKKVNNWHIFKDLARNELSRHLTAATGYLTSEQQLEQMLDGALLKIESHPNYKYNEVRYGALKAFENEVASLVNAFRSPQLGDISEGEEVDTYASMAYGAFDDIPQTRTISSSAMSPFYETIDSLGPQSGDIDEGEEVDTYASMAYGAFEDLPQMRTISSSAVSPSYGAATPLGPQPGDIGVGEEIYMNNDPSAPPLPPRNY